MPKGQYVRNHAFGTDDAQAGQNQGASISTTGEAELTMDAVEVIDEARFKTKAEEAKFMNEMVTIHIDPADDPNAPVFVHSGHQGVDQWIQRGTDQTIKRRFLYSLLAAKKKQFTCVFGKDGSGQEFNRLNGSAQTTHRLHVVRDDNPAGRAWYNSVMQEA